MNRFILENCFNIIDHRGKTPKISNTGILTLSAKSVKMGYIDYSKAYHISKQEFENFMTRGTPKLGDIILTTEGPCGNVAIVERENLAYAQRLVVLQTKDKKLYSNLYMAYFLRSNRGQKTLFSIQTGTTVQGIRSKELKKLEITLPGIDVQDEIANKIKIYDDKIENNNKIINTLDEIASLLYKRYFVDFEFPNDEGKPYKSNGGKFINSELGQIPIDWGKVAVKELVEFITGFEPGSNAYIDKKLEDCVQFFRVKDLSEKQEIYIKKDIIKKSNNVDKKEVLVSFDGTVGRVAIGYEGCYSSGMKKITPKNSSITNAFIYFYMKSDKTQNTLKEHATGTTILHASKSIDYLNITYIDNIMEKFNTIVEPMYEMILNKKEENEALVKTRDLLINELIK